jgi:hypothetical protein
MGAEEEKLLLILNLSTRWGLVVSIMPWLRFTPGERTPGTHWTGGWVGPRASLDAETGRKIFCLCRGSNPGRPLRSQSLHLLSYPGSKRSIKTNSKRHEKHPKRARLSSVNDKQYKWAFFSYICKYTIAENHAPYFSKELFEILFSHWVFMFIYCRYILLLTPMINAAHSQIFFTNLINIRDTKLHRYTK